MLTFNFVYLVEATKARHSLTCRSKVILFYTYLGLTRDKGYASRENREALKNKGIKDGIMHKAYKNKPLTRWQRLFNKIVSKTRYIIEQCFGTIKRRFKFERASYIGLKKVSGQLTFKAMCYNLLKALNMVKFA